VDIDDYVLVVSQPTNQEVYIVGQVGVIEEFDGDLLVIRTLKQGQLYDLGTVPKTCLVKITKSEAMAISWRK